MVAPILDARRWSSASRRVLFWNSLGEVVGVLGVIPFSPGLHLSALGQVSYIAAFVMLLVLARLQSFDPVCSRKPRST